MTVARKEINTIREASGLSPWTEPKLPYVLPLPDISHLLPQWTNRTTADCVPDIKTPKSEQRDTLGAVYELNEAELTAFESCHHD